MSTIYNNPDTAHILDGGRTDTIENTNEEIILPNKAPEALNSLALNDTTPGSKELVTYQERSFQALQLVDDIVLKNYLTKLPGMEALAKSESDTSNIILFKINKMVYEKDEYATDKFISVVSAMTYTTSSMFMVVDGHEDHTDFYLGVNSNDDKRQPSTVADSFKKALHGQFPGSVVEDYSFVEENHERSKQQLLLQRIKEEAISISSCVGIPSYKNSKGEYTNANFIQGLEKFASAMQGKKYTAIIIAENTPVTEISRIREGYESVFTELSAMSSLQLAYSTNESLANALTRTKGISDTVSHNDTEGFSDTTSTTNTHTKGSSETTTKSKGESKENFWGKAAKLSEPLMMAGAVLTATGAGAPVGVVMMGAAAVGQIGGVIAGKQINKSESEAHTTQQSDSIAQGKSHTHQNSHSDGTAHTEQFSEANGTTSTIGTSKNFTITVQNKHILEIQKRIERQLERLEQFEGTGLWAASAYFMSYGTEKATAEIAATIFRSIMQGEQSGVEVSAINTWYKGDDSNYEHIIDHVTSISHPIFSYHNPVLNQYVIVSPTSMLSSKEVAILMGLPRKSLPGLPVIEHVTLGKEVVKLNTREEGNSFELGCIFDQGIALPNNKVLLDVKSLTQHTFVTGSTGCGKSETVYKLIDSVRKANANFLIIEPAKGEYKNVFGTEHIFGTNPLVSNLLKINPFKFTEGVHVLEHADRLIEIFNVCWPMYAAMPAVLKEAVLNSYEDCGWDLIRSKNKYSNDIFPTFSDLIWELETVIEASSYSEEVKSNYKGSLITRVKSLANGINGEIFSGIEIGDEILFDENVIVDLSRIGSQETKSLIMGVLIMRLNEYRANSGIEANSSLRHVTILEEAHNILKRCSQEQSMEGSNVAGKSVEMISNAIAEMRTYGEGFIIVDQSPGAVDISAMRNTNTKIVMRLPEDSDRKIAGKSAAMKDNQVDEIAKLPTGVAVVYQNDWEEPVLCQIEQYKGERKKYSFMEDVENPVNETPIITEVLKFMMKEKASQSNLDINNCLTQIKIGLSTTSLPTYVKLNIFAAIQEYEETGTASIWKNNEYEKFSWVISGIFGSKQEVIKLAKQARDFDSLTEGLKKLIKNKVETVPPELELSICQSLMRDYSIGDENRLKIYNAWLQKTKSSII